MDDVYYLMNKNTTLISFRFHDFSKHSEDMIIIEESSVSFYEESESNFPFMLRRFRDSSRLNNWLNTRALPLTRSNYKSFIAHLGFTGRYQLLVCSFALSLNDTFWIKQSNLDISWEDVNLYSHQFSKELSMLAFGIPLNSEIKEKMSTYRTPELTTAGVLPKFWDRDESGIYLYKGGIFDPLNEFISHKILTILGSNHVNYSLLLTNDRWVSRCELFTSEKVGLLTFMEALAAFNEDMIDYSSSAFYNALYEFNMDMPVFYDMVVNDHILRNTDRHLTNFGFIYDNDTFEVLDIAPQFDHGASFYENCRDDSLVDRFSFMYRALPYDMNVDLVLANALNDERKEKILQLRRSIHTGDIADTFDLLQDKRALPASRRVIIEEWLNYIIDLLLKFKPGSSINRTTSTFDRSIVSVPKIEMW